jgi:hypothetical protein
MVGDYHPMYSFTLLPLGWEGTNHFGTVFREGKIQEGMSDITSQVYPDRYRERYPSFYYFESYLGVGSWHDPFKELSRYFGGAK